MPHNSIAARLAHSRSGCLRGANGVVAMVDTWRLSQTRNSSATIANSEPLIAVLALPRNRPMHVSDSMRWLVKQFELGGQHRDTHIRLGAREVGLKCV